MKLLSFFMLLLSTPAWSMENWQKCFDATDFNFSVDTFIDSKRISRTGCQMKFVEIRGKGSRLEINICDPKTKILEFTSLDATQSTPHFAGSSACPAPLFGADFSLEPSQKGGESYLLRKEKIKTFFNRIKEAIAPNIRFSELDKYLSSQNTMAEAKLVCAEHFMEEYLDNCISFEAPPTPKPTPKPTSPIPGIHPETISRDRVEKK